MPRMPAVSRKRPATGISKGSSSKTIKAGAALKPVIKQEDNEAFAFAFGASDTTTNNTTSNKNDSLKDRFIALFSNANYASGISNSALKSQFVDAEYLELVPIINALTKESRLAMSQSANNNELFYTLLADDVAAKFSGLDAAARLVYQVIEKSGTMGCWTKDIRIQTNVQQNSLTKILKSLENRRLIKPVKSVTAKSKKLYMLYDLTPSKELTGGVWYSDLEFDHEFISELRAFLMHCVRRLNGGKGVSMQEIHDKMVQAAVSRVELSPDECCRSSCRDTM
jgi:DNA-directed RNA polymerase III subunit RPC6